MDPHRIRLLRNPIRSYAWGSRTAISELLGQPSPASEPQAELWMGAHPSAPSMVVTEEGDIPLDRWIARDPESILSPRVVQRFGGRLPFLLKVLAVERPLSIQAHPSVEQARRGYARENAAGIPLDAPQRCYKDENQKNELICALAPFDVLCRFRKISEIVTHFDRLGASELEAILTVLRRQPTRERLAEFFRTWLLLEPGRRNRVLARARDVVADRASDSAWQWVGRLAEMYPGDVGVLAPLFLNVARLEPGEAIYLPAGELHSYLGGVGIEVMANSDNVLRGGLTSKHVDVTELLETLTFEAGEMERIWPRRISPCEIRYDTSAEEFALSTIQLIPGMEYTVAPDHGAEVWLCTEGAACFMGPDAWTLEVARGSGVLVPGIGPGWRVKGKATLQRASVGTVRVA